MIRTQHSFSLPCFAADPIGNVASIGPATAKPGAVVVFSISCTGSFPRVYTIEFGDGASESSNSSGLFTHTYNSTGTYLFLLCE